MRVVVDKDGEVSPVNAAYRVGAFRHGWADRTEYRIFYCYGCHLPFTANVGEETVHECRIST